jgi:hypothetical protein
MVMVFLLSLFFFILALAVRSKIHKDHQSQLAKIKQEERELDDRLEAVLVRRQRLGREAEALEDRIVLLEHGMDELGQNDALPASAVDSRGSNGERAAHWLLSSGKLSLDDYSKVLDFLKKNKEGVDFLEACLALNVISRSDAELASSH